MTGAAVGAGGRRVFLANVVAQTAIVVTGGLVRLTSSGLGCPTWPECSAGSYVPTRRQAQGLHAYVEFGNRMLTFALLVVVVASVVVAWRQVPRRRPLVLLAGAGLLGVAGQAVLGGITVLTGLNPFSVSAHFLLSMLLIAVAVVLYERSGDAGDGPPRPLVRREVSLLAGILVVLAAVVLSLGTVVTGSGPHAGDAASARYGLDPRTVSWLHADVVLLFVGLVVALLLAVRLVDGPEPARRRTVALLLVTLAQGVVGYVQYFTGLPELVVAVHLLGACLVWIATLRVPFALRERLDRGQPQRAATAAANLSGAPSA